MITRQKLKLKNLNETNQNLFTRKRNEKRKVESEPNLRSQKKKEENESVINLSKDDILRILTKHMPLSRASVIETFFNSNNIKNQQVPTIYSSFFFRKDIIKNFQNEVIKQLSNDNLIKSPFSVYNLYNKDDILNNTTYRPDILGSRYIQKTQGYTRESRENLKKVMELLSTKICSGVGEKYALNSVRNTIDYKTNKEEFDILFASTKIIEDVSLPIERRLEGVMAFVIVELGECKKYPSSYSINLICTSPKAIPGTGSILMGAFLYTILCHPETNNPNIPPLFPSGLGMLDVTSKITLDGSIIENCFFKSNEDLIKIQHIAVLELADSYVNVGGLCMYEKFGFQYDNLMYTNGTNIECFYDRINLPMKIDFNMREGFSTLNNEEKKDKIIKITAGLERGFDKSTICGIRDNNQKLLGYLKKIKTYINNTPGLNIKKFSKLFENVIEGKLSKQLEINRNSQIKIEEVINYLENQTETQTQNPMIEQKIELLLNIMNSPTISSSATASSTP